jgi:hypothetical protein
MDIYWLIRSIWGYASPIELGGLLLSIVGLGVSVYMLVQFVKDQQAVNSSLADQTIKPLLAQIYSEVIRADEVNQAVLIYKMLAYGAISGLYCFIPDVVRESQRLGALVFGLLLLSLIAAGTFRGIYAFFARRRIEALRKIEGEPTNA